MAREKILNGLSYYVLYIHISTSYIKINIKFPTIMCLPININGICYRSIDTFIYFANRPSRERNVKSIIHYTSHLLIYKQCCLSISCVAKIKTTTRFNYLIIEIVGHLWFWIAVNKPHQINIMVFGAISNILFTAQEAIKIYVEYAMYTNLTSLATIKISTENLHWCLCIAIMWWFFNIKVLREVWR